MNRLPEAASLAVVLRGEYVLLVRRRNEPDAGLWGFPGGRLELGETISECTIRELFEETGVVGTAQNVLTSVDVIRSDDNGRPAFHYILIAVACEFVSGDPVAADDAYEAEWVPVAEVISGQIQTSRHVDAVLSLAQQQSKSATGFLVDLE